MKVSDTLYFLFCAEFGDVAQVFYFSKKKYV